MKQKIVMERLIKYGARDWMSCESHSSRIHTALSASLFLLLLASTFVLSGCGGSSSANSSLIPPNLSGNWQFTMSPPSDGSFVGGLQGAFLLENNHGSVNGAATYLVSLTSFTIPCNTGSATITGSINGQAVTFNATAGNQTFTLTGTLSLDGSTMTGNYNATAGQASDGSPCGAAQTGLQWTATLVPSLTGSVQGSFQSGGGAAGLNEQEFSVSGVLIQQPNTGGSSSIVSGNLSFLNPVTNTSPYPCFTSASVYGQISGTTVSLEILGNNGSQWGQIGVPVGSLGGTGLQTVTLSVVKGGYALQGGGASYLISTAGCPGSLESITASGDYGNLCLSSSTSACQLPINLIPTGLSFSSPSGGRASQSMILTNSSNGILIGLTLGLTNESGAANFTETDLCGAGGVSSQGQPFNLNPGQSCPVTVIFAPLETCAVGTPPAQCPSPLTAILMVTVPSSNAIMTAPITGTAGANAASIRQFDFGGNNTLEEPVSSSSFLGRCEVSDANRCMTLHLRGCEARCED